MYSENDRKYWKHLHMSQYNQYAMKNKDKSRKLFNQGGTDMINNYQNSYWSIFS